MFHVKHLERRRARPRPIQVREVRASSLRRTNPTLRAPLPSVRRAVDELGRLELMRDGGLVSAVALLERGPSARFPHALVVVRDWLCPRAEERFAGAWDGSRVLSPGDDARGLVRASFGLSG